MANLKRYILFKAAGLTIKSSDCTTPWKKTIKCEIKISGVVDNKYCNLMVMEGPEGDLSEWIVANSTKIKVISKDEANNIGKTISPERIEKDDIGNEVKFLQFDVDNGQPIERLQEGKITEIDTKWIKDKKEVRYLGIGYIKSEAGLNSTLEDCIAYVEEHKSTGNLVNVLELINLYIMRAFNFKLIPSATYNPFKLLVRQLTVEELDKL